MAKQARPNPAMGSRARARRVSLGLTIGELAVMLGISSSRLSQIELEGVESISFIQEWARNLDMPAEELAFGINKNRKGTKA
jgi:transcriptional regulator with XRE-family HTH domain